MTMDKPTSDDLERDALLRALATDSNGLVHPERAQRVQDELKEMAERSALDDAALERVRQRVLAASRNPGGSESSQPWWARWFGGQPLRFAALASVVIALGAGVLWLQTSDPVLEVTDGKGAVQRVSITDYDATTPGVVAELLTIGLAPAVERSPETIRVQVLLPDPLPANVVAWAARWGLKVQAGQTLKFEARRRGG